MVDSIFCSWGSSNFKINKYIDVFSISGLSLIPSISYYHNKQIDQPPQTMVYGGVDPLPCHLAIITTL